MTGMTHVNSNGEPPAVDDERWNELKHEARERLAPAAARSAEIEHDRKQRKA
jgi:hypothetical protein